MIPVAGVDISAVELDFGSRQTIVEEQAYDPGDGDVEIDGGNPVVAIGIEVHLEFADLAPTLEVIVGIGALFVGNDLGQVAEEQRKCPFRPHDADCHIVLI
ncbi:MAG: hypothetical protein ACYSUK_07430 [Planctomycetota bacterium]